MAPIRLVVLHLFLIWITIFTDSSCEQCTNTLPGVMQLASGVDITALDFIPLGSSNSNRGLVENVFNFTICSGQKFPYYWNDTSQSIDYDLPDPVTALRLADNFDHVTVSLMLYGGSVKQTFMSQLSFDQGFAPLGTFSRNSKYTSLLKQYFGSNKTFAQIQTITSTVSIFMSQFRANESVKRSLLSHEFYEYITHKLPPKYEDNPSAYQTFVQRFGTHYFSQTYLSDYSHIRFALDPVYLLDSSDQQISDNMRIAYYDHFKRWDTIKANNISYTDNKTFKNVSEIVMAYSSRKDGSQWRDELTGILYSPDKGESKDLSIRYARLISITNLIDNQTIKAQVEIAIQMHRFKALLEELINIYNFSSNNYQLSNEDKDSFEKVKKLVNSGDISQTKSITDILTNLYYKALLARDRTFYDPVINDLYVTGAARLEFAKQICGLSFDRLLRGHGGQCEAPDIREGQRKTNHLYERYQDNEQNWQDQDFMYSICQDIFKDARELNLRYGLRADIASGLKTSCGKC